MSQLGRLLGKFRSLRRRERRSCAKQDLGAETQRVYNEILDTVTANTNTSNTSNHNTTNSNNSNNTSNTKSSSSLKSILRKREAPSPGVRSPSVTPSPSLAPSVASTSRIRSDQEGSPSPGYLPFLI